MMLQGLTRRTVHNPKPQNQTKKKTKIRHHIIPHQFLHWLDMSANTAKLMPKKWSQPSWSVRRNQLVTHPTHCKTPTSVEDLSPTHCRVEWLDCRTDRKRPATFPQHPPAVGIYRTRLTLQGPGELAVTVLMLLVLDGWCPQRRLPWHVCQWTLGLLKRPAWAWPPLQTSGGHRI